MSEKITVNVPHKLTILDAKARIDSGFEKIQQQISGVSLDMEQRWEGDCMHFSASAMGQKIAGQLHVFEEKVVVEVDLPWLMAKLAGGMREKLQKQTQILLEKK